jgi:site-specific DNA recombinase
VRRISRDANESTALEKQDARIGAYAEALGHDIVGDAADRDVSGRTDPFKRPELGKWLTDPALVASYDGLIASHLDRLGRSTRYVGKLLEWAEDTGKAVITLDPQIDFSTPTGKLLAFIISWLAEQELQLITSRSAATRSWLIQSGYLVGKPPLGYQVTVLDDHKTLAPDPVLAPRIREAVDKYLAGSSIREMAAWLDVPASSLKSCFRSETLIGRRKDAKGRTILRFEPILDRKTWARLQAELDRKSTAKGLPKRTSHWLTGIVFCPHCSGPMYRHAVKGKRHQYFRCTGTMEKPSKCRNMVHLEDIEAEVDKFMTGPFGRNSPVYETIVIAGDNDHSDDLAEVEQDLRELDYDDPVFGEKQAALLAERKRIKELPSVPDVVERWPTDVRVSEHWPTLDEAGRRSYLLENDIIVQAEKSGIEVKFREQTDVTIDETAPGRFSIRVLRPTGTVRQQTPRR